MKYLLLLSLFFGLAEARQIKVAIIDTGINNTKGIPVCQNGLIDVTLSHEINNKIIPVIKIGKATDTHGHGTNVAHLIEKFSLNANYCIYMIKYYDPPEKNLTIAQYLTALEVANLLDVDIVNMSISGYGYFPEEIRLLTKLSNKNVTIVTAAGNDRLDLSKNCVVYPACFNSPNIIVVGNNNRYSNRGGPVKSIVNADRVVAGGYAMSGTSQSTAAVTGMIIAVTAGARAPSSEVDTQKILQAVYIQSGSDKMVDSYIRRLERDAPDQLKEMLKYLYPITKSIVDNRITIEVTF